MSKREIVSGSTLKPSPQINLTEKEGSFVRGILKQRFESTVFPGKLSYLVEIEDTNGRAVLWDKANQKEVEVGVVAGDTVFIRDTTMLHAQLEQVKDGEKVEIIYTGKGKAKKGRKAPYFFTVNVIE